MARSRWFSADCGNASARYQAEVENKVCLLSMCHVPLVGLYTEEVHTSKLCTHGRLREPLMSQAQEGFGVVDTVHKPRSLLVCQQSSLVR
mmetsp:Transcript_411/g.809  ORF Transcript_411/g.809 Transcript_411/m.809 type:complete len:90 (-) Transcript_411:98-367(-)